MVNAAALLVLILCSFVEVHRREAKAKGVNPLRVLAGASESSDSGASSDDSARSDCAKVRVEQVIPIEVKAEVVSGSETEDEEPAVDPAEESDEGTASTSLPLESDDQH